jgi:hypothetical protein
MRTVQRRHWPAISATSSVRFIGWFYFFNPPLTLANADRYGDHPAFYRHHKTKLPMYNMNFILFDFIGKDCNLIIL